MASLISIRGLYYLQFYDRNRTPSRKTIALKTSDLTRAEREQAVLELKVSEGLLDPWEDHEPHQPVSPRRYLALKEAADEFLRERHHIKASSARFY